MRAQRIKTGFRRIGLVFAAPLALVAAILGGAAIYTLATLPPPGLVVTGPDTRRFNFPDGTSYPTIAAVLSKEYGRPITVGYMNPGSDNVTPYSTQMWARNDATHQGSMAIAAAVLGVFAYVVAWALGWIIAGFAG